MTDHLPTPPTPPSDHRPPNEGYAPNVYPCISRQIANMLRMGRDARRAGLTEVARLQAEHIAQIARDYIEFGLPNEGRQQ